MATKVAGAGVAGFAGNLVVGGIVGMGVDAVTGSTLEHFPNPVFASLLPLRNVPPAAVVAANVPGKVRAKAYKPEKLPSVFD